MTLNEAQAQIIRALNDYEEAHITRASLLDIIARTLDAVYNAGYAQGVEDEEVDEDIIFEAEFDLEDANDEDDDPRF